MYFVGFVNRRFYRYESTTTVVLHCTATRVEIYLTTGRLHSFVGCGGSRSINNARLPLVAFRRRKQAMHEWVWYEIWYEVWYLLVQSTIEHRTKTEEGASMHGSGAVILTTETNRYPHYHLDQQQQYNSRSCSTCIDAGNTLWLNSTAEYEYCVSVSSMLELCMFKISRGRVRRTCLSLHRKNSRYGACPLSETHSLP